MLTIIYTTYTVTYLNLKYATDILLTNTFLCVCICVHQCLYILQIFLFVVYHDDKKPGKIKTCGCKVHFSWQTIVDVTVFLSLADTRADRADRRKLFRHYTVGSYDSFDASR